MSCAGIAPLLEQSPLDRAATREAERVLSPVEATRLAGHLPGCAACRELLAKLTRVHAQLDPTQEADMKPTAHDLRAGALAAMRRARAAAAPPAPADDSPALPRGSGRGRAPAPRRSEPTAVLVSIASLTALIVSGVLVTRADRQPAPAVNSQHPLDPIMAEGREGERLFREWNRARHTGAPDDQRLHQEAKLRLQSAVERLQALLSRPPYSDAEGTIRAEYEGYERPLQDWATLLVDLEKGATLAPGG